MKERVNLIKNVVSMKVGKVNRKERKLSKKDGFGIVEIIVISAIVFIVGALLKEPISNLASAIMTEVSRIAKAWFTGL